MRATTIFSQRATCLPRVGKSTSNLATHTIASGVFVLLATVVLAASVRPAEARDFFSRYNPSGYSWTNRSAWIERPDTNDLPGSNDVIKIGGNEDNRYAYDLIRLRGGATPTVLRGYIGFDNSSPPASFGYLTIEEGSRLTVRENLYVGGHEKGELAISGGGSLRAAGLKLGSYSGKGEGEVRLYVGSEIRAGSIFGGGGPKDFQWRGGTLKNMVGGNTTIAANLGGIRLMNSTGDHFFHAETGRTITVNCPLTGTGEVFKQGNGTLIFNAANTYATPTAVMAGILRLGASNRIADGSDLYVAGGTFDLGSYSERVDGVGLSAGAIVGSGTLTANGFVVEAGTISARLASAGDLQKIGAGTVTMTLSGGNTYRTTVIREGSIRLTANDCIPDGGTSTLVVAAGASLNLNNHNETVVFPASSNPANEGSILLGNGTLTVTGSATNHKFSGTIDGSGSLVKTGTGTQIFDGTLSPGTIHVNQGTLRSGKSNLIHDRSNLTVNGGTFDLRGYTDMVGVVTLNGWIEGSGTLNGARYDVQDGSIRVNLAGSGVDLIKSTDGVVALNGANSYTGQTLVEGGRLKIGRDDALHDSSILAVDDGAIFDLNGHNETVLEAKLYDGTLTGSHAAGTAGTLTANRFELFNGTVTAHLAGHNTDLEKWGSNNQPDGGTVTLYKSNSYTGDTLIRGGTLRLGASDVIPDGSVLGMDILADDPNCTFDLDNHSETLNGLWGRGFVSLGSGTLTSMKPDGWGSRFRGSIDGSGGFVKTGGGVQLLDGANTYQGATTIQAGTLAVNGSLAAESQVTVTNGGTLAGTGIVAGPVTANSGAAVSPGPAWLPDPTTTGVLSTGNLMLNAGATLATELKGLVPGSGYDQVAVSGAVSVTGAVLDLSLGFVPSRGDTFVIVDNDASDSVAGEFFGYPDDSRFMLDGYRFGIDYQGGDGNDVALFLPAAQVVGRHIFYNGSSFDNPGDDDAIAPDKQPLLPGQTADFDNYTSYSRGINGIMIDVADSEGTPAVDDFEFKVGNDDTPDDWDDAPLPTSITVRPGEGDGGSDRITILWEDNAIEKEWLQIILLATDETGLLEDDVFYFGNAIGESGTSPGDTKVNAIDMLAARNNPHNFFDQALIDDFVDFDRNTRVNATDMLIARNNTTNFFSAIRLISVPGGKSAALATVPEPGTLVMLLAAAVGLLLVRRWRT